MDVTDENGVGLAGRPENQCLVVVITLDEFPHDRAYIARCMHIFTYLPIPIGLNHADFTACRAPHSASESDGLHDSSA